MRQIGTAFRKNRAFQIVKISHSKPVPDPLLTRKKKAKTTKTQIGKKNLIGATQIAEFSFIAMATGQTEPMNNLRSS